VSKGADDLETQFLKQAPAILSKLREQGYENVGVLKFRIKKGNEPATDRAGTLNLRLTEKLELALILANKVSEPIGIIRNASQTAATIEGANHLSTEGRKKLFEKAYPLAWGEEQVVPDAFIAGVALISGDLRTMTIGLMTFDQTGEEFVQLAKFDIKPDLEDLLESGESFTVRGVFDQANLQLTDDERKDKATEEAVSTSLKVKEETAQSIKPAAAKVHPLAPGANSPIKFEIFYDGKPQSIEFRQGAAFVAEPAEGQKVTFVVRRKDASRPRLGVVVKVNGENTLFRQKEADAQCSMWVFEPRLSEFGITGFQVDGQQLQLFKVLSQAESQAKEIDYGEFVGTISVSVFQERTVAPKPSPQLLTDEGEDFEILTRGVFPKEQPQNLGALKQQLARSATRGLITEGATIARQVEKVKFNRDPIPIMTATIKYYNPQDLPQ
jgi:hypothetical protein